MKGKEYLEKILGDEGKALAYIEKTGKEVDRLFETVTASEFSAAYNALLAFVERFEARYGYRPYKGKPEPKKPRKRVRVVL
jgi:hypothetical protein